MKTWESTPTPAASRSARSLPAIIAAAAAFCFLCQADLAPAQPGVSQSAARLRCVIETDAGGDPDDEQSFVRFLLYANEWDVEAIIASRPVAREGENRNPERTGLGIVRKMIEAYGECFTNLVQHDARYPTAQYLLERSFPGYGSDVSAGVIISLVDSKDPRPLWFCNWGTDNGSAPSCLKRALDRVLAERGPSGYAAFKQKLRLASADKFGEHTTNTSPAFTLWVDTFRPELDGKRWYHRFSALTAQAGGFDVERDVRTGHGPLGALYPTNTTHWLKEGDTMTFLYLVPNGLNVPDEPGWGGWAGRYGRQEAFPGKPYYWANQADAWQGATNRDNTLKRWAAAIQNDFRARLDWCVKPRDQANHPPEPFGNSKLEPAHFRGRPGSTHMLYPGSATDPDQDDLHFEWFVYPEAGTYTGPLQIETNMSSAHLRIPADAAGKSIHLVLAVTDSGEPPLTRYRRVVLDVTDQDAAERILKPLFVPPPEFSKTNGTYRSPLLFDNGKEVRDQADWTRRRQEILDDWQKIMGPWPPLLEKPGFQILGATPREDFLQHRVRLEIAPGQSADGWLLVPNMNAWSHRLPAVLVVYYEPETSVGLGKEPLRDFGYQLARRGFVTLSIGTPGGNAWKPETGTAQCQPLSFHAYVAANCWQVLANLPYVDCYRIGVVGHSYGGKWALFAGALWDKFAAVAVSDPGIVFDETRPNVNYWEPWYLGADPKQQRPKAGLPSSENPRTGAYRQLLQSGHDLHELHALIAPRPFFVSGGSEDPPSRWLALSQLLKVNQLLGESNRVAMSSRPDHAPNEQSNEQIYSFFECLLKNGRGIPTFSR